MPGYSVFNKLPYIYIHFIPQIQINEPKVKKQDDAVHSVFDERIPYFHKGDDPRCRYEQA
jgi:hypothetical protein